MWNWAENQIKLFLFRHGAAPANKEHRYLGRTDQGLSPEGAEALEKGKKAGMYPAVDALFLSPLKRCLETAAILYPKQEPVIIPEWEEIDFGAFEGKNYEELKGDSRYQAWIDSNGTLPFPEGESREAFISRCEKGFYKMLAILEKKYKQNNEQDRKQEMSVGLVVHGGTIMALFDTFSDGEYFDYQTGNGHGYCCRLEREHGKLRLLDCKRL